MASSIPKSLRCAIYTRKSTEHGLELEFNSLDAQREACEAYIKSQASQGWKALPQLYDDPAYSGGNLERPALRRLLADIEAGSVDVVVVYKIDRLTRSLADFAKLVEAFDARSISFVAVTQQFNTTTSMGRLTLNVLLSFAQFERELSSERVRDKIAASRAKGKWTGGTIPFGYKTHDKKLVINAPEAEIVRYIFKRYLELGSFEPLVLDLDAKGMRSRIKKSKGVDAHVASRFTYGPLAYLLNNRVYVGEVTHKGKWHPGEHRAIVNRETFDAVQAQLSSNSVTRKQRRSESGALLMGKLFDDSGNRMSPSYSTKNGVRYRFYVSTALLRGRKSEAGSLSRISAIELEAAVLGAAREAKRLARPIIDQWEREFEERRQVRQLTEGELQNAIWRRYLDFINGDEKFRTALPTDEDQTLIWKALEAEFGEYDIDAFRIFESIRDQFEVNQRERTTRLARMRVEAARGETKLIADVALQVIEDRQLGIDVGSPEYRKLAHGLQRAELEGLTRAAERDEGDFSGVPKDQLVQPPTVFDPPKGEQILELFDRYARERSARVSKDTWNQNRKVVALFDDFVGGKAHISALNRKNVREWKDKLFAWPVKAIESKVFRGLSFLDVIEKNKVVGKPVILEKTINRYLSALGGFCEWLLASDYLSEDVMRGMYLDVDRRTKSDRSYSEQQIKAIFSSPLFHRCAGDKLEHVEGKEQIGDWRYWIPLIAVYSGARLGEISQLQVADVRELHGVWIFHISEEGAGGKSVKTAGSERVVPVHSKLIEMGFLKFHARMAQLRSGELFPEIKPDARGYISGKPSTFFNDYLREIGVKVDKSKNFHSFRHTFTDAMRRAGYLNEQFGMLLGHTKATTTGKYGIMPEGPLQDRVKMIEAVTYTI